MPEPDARAPFLGLITAMEAETNALCGRARPVADGLFLRLEPKTDLGRVVCLQCGPGPERSLAAARRLLDEGAGALLCAGVAGGLDGSVACGELLVTDKVILAHEGNPLPVPMRDSIEALRLPAAAIEALGGTRTKALERALLTTSAPLLEAAEKMRWFGLTGAAAADMEAAGVALAAMEAGVPFLAAKAVCDPAASEVSKEMIESCTGKRGVGFFSLLRAVLRRPSLFARLWRTGQDYSRALGALEKSRDALLRVCLENLGSPEGAAAGPGDHEGQAGQGDSGDPLQ